MEFYKVTNGNWLVGYYRLKENADAEVERQNNLVIELTKQGKNIDQKAYYVVTCSTID